jgi:RNase H-like domain found in reverse transcriptase/Integrase zinc binding domain/Reverse transcriptase (RNA-dependent DNA polymerase)/Integrase core domain
MWQTRCLLSELFMQFGKRTIGCSGKSPSAPSSMTLQNFQDFNPVETIIINENGDSRPYGEVDIVGHKLKGLLDSGCNITILASGAKKLLEALKVEITRQNIKVATADGTAHQVLGSVELPYTFCGKSAVIPTLIVPTLRQKLILGMDFWTAFGIRPIMEKFEESKKINNCINEIKTPEIPDVTTINDKSHEPDQNPYEILDDIVAGHNLTNEQKQTLTQVIKSFKIVEGDKLDRTNILQHHIDVGNAKPIHTRPYIYSPAVEEKIHEEVKRMERLGVIEPSSSPWSHPLVAVTKSNGKTRVCMDCRKLNAITIKESYPVPNLNRILSRIRHTKYLSTLDLQDAYFQVALDEESRDICSFRVSGVGSFRFVSMVFGLHNAAQCLTRIMDEVLGIEMEPFVFYYHDDIIIATDTFERHLEKLSEVASKLKKANLSINLQKSRFCRPEITYVGYTLDETGLKPNSEKVSAILNIPNPKNLRDVRGVIGMAGWYRRFIPNHSTLMAPITDLTKNPNKKFVWTEEANQALIKLKSLLTAEPILTMPDYGKEFTLYTDASDIGVGAMLAQGEDSDQKTVAYFSQKLNPCQTRYSVTERECLAVLLAIEKFRHYLLGSHFTVVTDHSALQWLLALKTPVSNRLCRWIMSLQQYHFSVKHRKGSDMAIADGLSRTIESITVEPGDKWYNDLAKRIQNEPEKYPDFRIQGSRILKFCKGVSEIMDSDFVWKAVVPESQVKNVLLENHDNCGHMGVQKTFDRIRQRFYWAKMKQQIETYISQCEICKKSKINRKSNAEPMGNPRVASTAFEILSIDFIGSFPRSKKGNSDLLVVLDWFSKFVWCLPMKKQCSKKTVEFLENEIFYKFSTPKIIICDNGPQFKSKIFRTLTEKYNTKIQFSANYHAQNNPVERVNAVIEDSIRVYLGNDQREWDEHLPKIIWSMNTSVHSATKFTPFFLVFGREAKISGNDYHTTAPPDLSAIALERKTDLEKVTRIVMNNMGKAQKKSASRYNLRKKPKNYQENEIVYRKNFKLSDASKQYSAKLGDRHIKCIITKKLGSNTYRLADFDTMKDVGVFSSKDFFN